MALSSGKRLLILVGPPGVGKSTWIAKMEDNLDATVCSSDRFVELDAADKGLTYNEAFEESIKWADKAYWAHVRLCMKFSVPMIVCDRTHMSVKSRRKLIQLGKDHDYRIEAYLFKNVYWTTWIERLKGREGKTIPANVIGSMLLSYEQPSHQEGFDELCYI
ncbi:putative polynucleotide kinase protein [Rhizobium phage RHph_I1_18]|nr:putative polynucleotide kinase protein [Rhizobium phage RHph_I1_18]